MEWKVTINIEWKKECTWCHIRNHNLNLPFALFIDDRCNMAMLIMEILGMANIIALFSFASFALSNVWAISAWMPLHVFPKYIQSHAKLRQIVSFLMWNSLIIVWRMAQWQSLASRGEEDIFRKACNLPLLIWSNCPSLSTNTQG